MVIRITHLFLFCAFFTLNSWGQPYLRFKSFQRIAYQNKASFAWSGAAVDLGYRMHVLRGITPTDRYTKLDVGAELGFLEWGNQVLFYVGFARHIPISSKVYFSPNINLYNGIILFRPKPLYEFAAEVQGTFGGLVSPALYMGFGTGVRYSVSPRYKRYSSVFSYWHFTGELVFVFRKPKAKLKKSPISVD